MKLNFTILLLLLVLNNDTSAQCTDVSFIYSFDFGGKTYEVVRENKTWGDAALCAVERGGYLAEINSEEEQNAIFAALGDASITNSNTTAFECGSCSFVWIGGHDTSLEGKWIWDGNNDGVGPQFWMGGINGEPVDDSYTNWGNVGEPDNFNNQDGLALALQNWIFGVSGEWNDLSMTNLLYYVIEYNNMTSIPNNDLTFDVSIHPNPTTSRFKIVNRNTSVILKIELFSNIGQRIKTYNNSNQSLISDIDISELNSGLYFLNIYLEDDIVLTRKIIKK